MKRQCGEYVIFIDSDDYIEVDMLNKMYKKAKTENSDLVVCDYYEVYDTFRETKKALTKFSEDNIINYMLSNPSPWNKLIKTHILKQNNIKFLENHIYEDLATMPILTGYITTISYVQEPLYNYIIRSGSTMRQPIYNKKLDSIFVAVNHLEKEFSERNLLKSKYEEIEYLIIYHLLYAASGRFLEYPEGKNKVQEILTIIKDKYPNWRKNKYYKMQNLQFKITCNIFFSNNFMIINLYNVIRNYLKRRK